MRVLRAGWVLPVAGEPIADGAVAIADGRIVDVGPGAELAARHPGASRHLGADAIVMPGLVDAHCHLEWSCFDGVIGSRTFAEWLRAFLPLRGRLTRDDHLTAARYGATRALCAGTTTLADSGPTGTGVRALAESGQRGSVHLEAFGTSSGPAAARQAAQVADDVAALAAEAASVAGARVTVGVSPHAPYTVGPELWRALAARPDLDARPWATHIAESSDEERGVVHGDGPLAELFAGAGFALGRWDGAGAGVAERMDADGALRAGLVAAHCVRMHPGDARRLRSRGVHVAHCPRSNAYLRCGTAPLGALLAEGVGVALGTDSPASGGDYDLRAEARACRAVHGPGAPTDAHLVRLITLDAARTLGLHERLGMLAPGASADILVVRTAAGRTPDDPHTAALDAASRVDMVVVAGEDLVAGGRPTRIDTDDIHAAAGAITARLR